MAHATTTTNVFNAIANSHRRDILDILARGGKEGFPVGFIIAILRLPQPEVSKHLGVLRKVGVVSVRKSGLLRIYRLNPKGLKPVKVWMTGLERSWSKRPASPPI